MLTAEEIKKLAFDAGFDYVHDLDTQTLTPLQSIRETCETNKCGAYNTNWGCPPHGTIEEDTAKLRSFKHGIIVQVVGRSDDPFDVEMYTEAANKFAKSFRELYDKLKPIMPDCMALGAGGCKVCSKCAYPEPCRFPDKRTEALEGYGIFITQLCKDNDVTYYYGSGTLAYNGAILW